MGVVTAVKKSEVFIFLGSIAESRELTERALMTLSSSSEIGVVEGFESSEFV
jgi:hypothetical protein